MFAKRNSYLAALASLQNIEISTTFFRFSNSITNAVVVKTVSYMKYATYVWMGDTWKFEKV